ncbi:MAG: T9SS type A sorting domain-containing protein [Ignavibacteria bacterium]|nr:T9SS type A sorting domain-containing protein [Ignavibacteria bacterium]
MKKIFKFSILFGFYSLLFGICYAQWQQPDIRLTNAAGFSTNSDLSSSGSFLHAVWQDTRDGNTEIFYKRSTNEGVTWESDLQLTNQPTSKALPTISSTGSSVHIVWQENRTNDVEIYYKRSTDNGVTWESEVRLTNSSGVSQDPIIKAEGSSVNVIWRDTRSGTYEMFYKRSIDGGITWSSDTMLTAHSTGLASLNSLAVYGSNLHIAWSDTRHNDDYEIFYKRSTNGGLSWGADTRLTNELRISESPSIKCNSSDVHITWVDLRDSNINAEVYYKRSTDNGNSWSPDTRLTVYAYAGNPSILLSGTIVHVIWGVLPSGSEIHYKRSTNSGNSWETSTQVSSSFSGAYYPNIAVTGSKAHIIWHDVRNGSTNSELYYDFNPTGNTIGVTNISTEIPAEYSLSQNYPNPFNPMTKFKFQMPISGFVKLTVFDMLGKEIETLVNENMKPGTYEVDFDGSKNSSGVYFYKLITGDFFETKKMILIK